jgi:hypothetical protein
MVRLSIENLIRQETFEQTIIYQPKPHQAHEPNCTIAPSDTADAGAGPDFSF